MTITNSTTPSKFKQKVSFKENQKIVIVNNIYVNSANELNKYLTGDFNVIEATQTINLNDWKKDFIKQKHSKDYQQQILSKYLLLFDKEEYSFLELINLIKNKIDIINENDRLIKLTRSILNFLENKEYVNNYQLIDIRKKIKNLPINTDNHVPTDKEIKQTLSQLSSKHNLLYLIYLTSGLRKVEGSYLLKNISTLKYQDFKDFVKVTMDYKRKNKNSYFCYLPRSLFLQLNNSKTTILALEQEIKRKKLIPIKYCRKWFYTKCIELGVPESIADYYQGRTSNSVGANHYLSRQFLADKHYTKIYNFFKVFFKIK
jgi:intergrase/recombinase